MPEYKCHIDKEQFPWETRVFITKPSSNRYYERMKSYAHR